MSYHDISNGGTPSSARQSMTNAQGQVAPIGFHYMPDGTLMSDIEHARLYGEKIISNFDLDLSSLPATKTTRNFTITGTDGASFTLEIKNEDNYYYNFVTKSFQVAQTRLEDTITTQGYTGSITFPAVTDDDQYDIYFFATPGTKHARHTEVRFGDNSIDINSSIGSNSLLMQKVIYQFATDLTLDLAFISPTSAIDIGSFEKASFTSPRGSRTNSSFSITCTVDSLANAYQIIKQPTIDDVLAYNSITFGSLPEDSPGEDIFPAVTSTDTVDGDFTAGTATKIVMDTAVADTMTVGDKITIATTDRTDTVDGNVTSGQKIVMDSNVVTKMAVGDRVSGLTNVPEEAIVTVTHLDPDGDNAKKFQIDLVLGGGPAASDGRTLTFTPKCNRLTFRVDELNPDDDNANAFSYIADDGASTFGIVDGSTLSFSIRKNYQWPVDDISRLSTGQKIIMDSSSTNAISGSIISNYENSITRTDEYGGTRKVILDSLPALRTKNNKPVVTRGELATQAGNVVFSEQQIFGLNGDSVNIGGYGAEKILKVSGYKINLTNLAIAPVAITTTTTSAINDNLVVPVASVNGVVDGITTVSGLGINASLADPKVVSRSVTSGAGDLTLDSIQTLEDDVTLTLAGASQTVTITGNIEIIQSPPDSIPDGTTLRTLYFDVEKLLSIT